jgi:hypothetical protein
MKIEELFEDWVDFDVAEYYLCCLLGLTKYDESFDEFRRIKGLYNTGNQYEKMFFEFLEKMAEAKLLEKDDGLGYRWNKSFNEYWLKEGINENPKSPNQ